THREGPCRSKTPLAGVTNRAARFASQPWRFLYLAAARRRALLGGGGLSRSDRNRSRSRSESGDRPSSQKVSSSSGMTLALRMRTSVSLTCSIITVLLAKDRGRLIRALLSVVRVSLIMGRFPQGLLE